MGSMGLNLHRLTRFRSPTSSISEGERPDIWLRSAASPGLRPPPPPPSPPPPSPRAGAWLDDAIAPARESDNSSKDSCSRRPANCSSSSIARRSSPTSMPSTASSVSVLANFSKCRRCSRSASGGFQAVAAELKLKAKLESSLSYSFKRLVPGAFNVGLMRQPAPPYQAPRRASHRQPSRSV